jgi:hypothetical protein
MLGAVVMGLHRLHRQGHQWLALIDADVTSIRSRGANATSSGDLESPSWRRGTARHFFMDDSRRLEGCEVGGRGSRMNCGLAWTMFASDGLFRPERRFLA